MSLGPLGIWEIIVIVGVALLIFGPAQLPKIARGVGKAVKSAKDMKDEITGIALDDEEPPQRAKGKPKPALDPAENADRAATDVTRLEDIELPARADVERVGSDGDRAARTSTGQTGQSPDGASLRARPAEEPVEPDPAETKQR